MKAGSSLQKAITWAFSRAVPGWDTEAEQERAAAAVPQCSGRTRNGSVKTNSSVVLNWEGKEKTNR